MACDSLPDVYNERDITTFASLWRDQKDKTLDEAIEKCQIAENVLTSMQEKLGEAESEYDVKTIDWCRSYMKEMREIELDKWKSVTAYILENLEIYTKMTDKEIEASKNQKQTGKKGDINLRPEIKEVSQTPDLVFSLFANVQSKNLMHHMIRFTN